MILLVLVSLVAFALVIGEGWVLFNILSQQGRLLLRIEALDDELAPHDTPPVHASSTQSIEELPVDSSAHSSPLPLSTPDGTNIPFTSVSVSNTPPPPQP